MPVLEARTLEARARCYDRYYNRYYNCTSRWNSWVRWLVLGLIVAAAIVLFMLFSCVTARRRRKMGHQPWRGTGWAVSSNPPAHNAPTYNNNAQPYYANYNNSNNPAPPPAYQPGGANQGYYGQQNGTELQQPQQTYGGYRSGESAFEPPKGPPPGR
ncbi:uncharacterized protein RCC_00122 [Ramularia collo-cygni]|uniref:Chitin synthesis regulation, Congo red resistance, RCR protein n=1 Tax=Ramularia collo-cygni TaxID=112498 RepID=A0A2D3UYA1_9PEZI|nr:uncharacterized protein RCC_00122 [Ramularia collo-cygni]CZT14149.1 uncharacterized protein RCC_00122 [Ramularia collo-cygni]